MLVFGTSRVTLPPCPTAAAPLHTASQSEGTRAPAHLPQSSRAAAWLEAPSVGPGAGAPRRPSDTEQFPVAAGPLLIPSKEMPLSVLCPFLRIGICYFCVVVVVIYFQETKVRFSSR